MIAFADLFSTEGLKTCTEYDENWPAEQKCGRLFIKTVARLHSYSLS